MYEERGRRQHMKENNMYRLYIKTLSLCYLLNAAAAAAAAIQQSKKSVLWCGDKCSCIHDKLLCNLH